MIFKKFKSVELKNKYRNKAKLFYGQEWKSLSNVTWKIILCLRIKEIRDYFQRALLYVNQCNKIAIKNLNKKPE